MAGEYKYNQVVKPSTPAAGKNSLYAFTDKLLHELDENGQDMLIQPMIFAALSANYTLASQTTVQKLFNVPTNGALTVAASTSYFFECMLILSSMSATSGNFKFDLLGGGTATLTSTAWIAQGQDATTPGTAGAFSGSATAANVSSGDIVTAATGTGASVLIKGIVRVNAAGTLIPSILLTTAAAAVVNANSYIQFTPVGSNTVTTVGNWS